MAIVVVTLADWDQPAFWSSLSADNLSTLDLSGLGPDFTADLDASSDTLTLSDGATTFVVGSAGTSGADSTLASGAVHDFDNLILPDGNSTARFDSDAQDILGGAGDDDVDVTDGDDYVDGGAGDDTIQSSGGNNTLSGGSGDDSLTGGAEADTLTGGTGDDNIEGGGGDDLIEGDGGAGTDNLLVNGSFESTTLGAGGLDMNAQLTGWQSDNGGLAQWDSGHQGVSSTDGGDFVEIDRNANEQNNIYQDVATTAGETYTMTFDATARPGSEGETLEVYWNDEKIGEVSPETGGQWDSHSFDVTGSGGVDRLEFRETASEDNSLGPLLDNVALVVAGDDTIDGGSGEDTIDGGGGDDVIEGGTGADEISGGDGDDVITDSGTNPGMTFNTTGTDGVALSGPMDDFPTQALTFEIQFASDSAPAHGTALVSYANGADHNEFLLFAETGSTLEIYMNHGKYDTGISSSALLDGSEQTLSVSWDSATGAVNTYVNGSLADSGTFQAGAPLSAGGTLALGQEQDVEGGVFNAIQLFEGTIYEARLWNDVRSAEEIGGDIGDDTGGLVSQWVPNADASALEDAISGNDLTTQGDVAPARDGSNAADTIDAGAGDDHVDAGAGDDAVEGGSGDDTLLGGAGDDTLSGGDGEDSLLGGAGDDSLLGGEGADQLFGGAGADTLEGGDGSDSMTVGAGDQAQGDGGDDSFSISAADIAGGAATVVGGETDETLGDTLNITGPASIVMTGAESGTVTWLDGSTLTFSEIENVNYVPCFTPGTRIKTARGEVDAADVRPGDRVLTRDNGYQEVRWSGGKPLSVRRLTSDPALQPVRITAGALGPGVPERDMVVSPQHRLVMGGPDVALYFGETEVLAAAAHLVGRPGITRDQPEHGVVYLHFMFDRHELVLSDGLWTESFQPGDLSMNGLDDGPRRELLTLFPDLATAEGREAYAAARPTLKAYQAGLLGTG